MRKTGIDKLAFLVVLGAVALVAVAAINTAPAYSEDSRTDPAAVHRSAVVKVNSVLAIEQATTPSEPAPATDESRYEAESVDTDGYQWSGSRSKADRYFWSHRPN